MIDFSAIDGFDWDDGNRLKSLDKHDVSRDEAEQVFDDPNVMVFKDAAHSQHEERFQALGRDFMRRMLSVSFTLRRKRTLIRVISAREMDARERRCYD